jgi:hypothetical protein
MASSGSIVVEHLTTNNEIKGLNPAGRQSVPGEKKSHSWTNFSQQDKAWAEFSTLEVAVCMSHTHDAMKQNCLA